MKPIVLIVAVFLLPATFFVYHPRDNWIESWA